MTASTASRRRQWMTRIRQEGGVGMEFVVSAIIGAGMWANVSGGVGMPWTLTQTAFWFGLGACIAVIIADKAGHDNHGNTLVTVGSVAAGSISWRQALKWFAAQFLAFWLTCFALRWVYHDKAVQASYAAPLPSQYIPWFLQFGVGIMAGFCFTLLVLLVTDHVSSPFLKGLFIGTALFVAIMWSAIFTGGGVNTARDLGPMVFIWHFAWSPVLGELAGAALAGLLYKRLVPRLVAF